MRKSIIKNNTVINVIDIAAEDVAAFVLPEGCTFGIDGGEIGYTFDGVNNVYVPPAEPEQTLEERRINLMLDIDSRSEEMIRRGFAFDGETFSLSANAQSNWNALLTAISGGLITLPHEISTIDEKAYSLNDIAFFGAALNAVDSILKSGRDLKTLIADSDTPEDIEDNR